MIDNMVDKKSMRDREVIDAFVAHLRDHGFSGLQVGRRPDEENRGSEDIDAIAGHFAIEHTSIDTLPNQRRDSNWFMHVVGDLEQELPFPEFHLKITLEYGAVGKGQNWKAIRETLKIWINDEGPRLPEGQSIHENITGIPFRLHIMKSSRQQSGVFFSRFAPEDDTLPMRVRFAFERKANKLVKYKLPGAVTILLIENGDIALMNNAKMIEAIQIAFPVGLPTGLDQVWFADTSIPSALEFYNFTSEFQAAE